MAKEELQESSEIAFQAYVEPLYTVTAFKYLGRVMTAGDDDWPSVAGNLQKERKSWGWMSRILSWEGAYPKVSGHFFKAEVKVVLLSGEETWVLTPLMERDLISFQQRVVRRLTGRQPRMRGDESWYYPLLAVAMAETGFKDIRVYVTRRQNKVAQYIAT